MRSIGRNMTGRSEVYVKRSGAKKRLYCTVCHPSSVTPSSFFRFRWFRLSESIQDRDGGACMMVGRRVKGYLNQPVLPSCRLAASHGSAACGWPLSLWSCKVQYDHY